MAVRANSEQQVLLTASEGDVRQVLERVLNSRHFVHAPKKQMFLRLICDFYLSGRAGELNEYLIGREVFGKSEDYNPAADPIVRVGAHELRKKLELYYQQDGAQDDLRLDIPVGSYEPIFIRQFALPQTPAEPELTIEPASVPVTPPSAQVGELTPSVTQTPPAPVTEEPVPLKLQKRLRLLYALIALLAGSLLVLALLYVTQPTAAPVDEMFSPNGIARPVWSPFLQEDSGPLLILSSPAVYRLMNAGDTEQAVKNSVELPPDKATMLGQALKDNFAVRNSPASPRLVLSLDTYTGLGEAIAAHRVTDLLRAANRDVTLKRSRTVSAEDLKDHNVILLGSVWSNEWAGKLPSLEDFVYTGQATIENRRPRDGEAAEYSSRFDPATGKLLEDYALVTVKPNISGANVVMVLAGLRSPGTEAAAEYVTNKTYLGELSQRLRLLTGKSGPPRYFQALLKVGVENGIPTTISLVALHPLATAEK